VRVRVERVVSVVGPPNVNQVSVGRLGAFLVKHVKIVGDFVLPQPQLDSRILHRRHPLCRLSRVELNPIPVFAGRRRPENRIKLN